jgi:hypothetical protein
MCRLWKESVTRDKMGLFFSHSFFSLFFYSHVHTLFRPFQSPASHPLPVSNLPPLSSRQNLFCPFLQFCWSVDISNNKQDIAFLLVEIRIAIQRDPSIASTHKCITTQIVWSLPDLFTTSRWPSHIDLCHFKVTVLLASLQWGHQPLSCLGFPTFPYSSCMCPSLSVGSMSNNITTFVLDLKTTYEGEHTFLAFWVWLTWVNVPPRPDLLSPIMMHVAEWEEVTMVLWWVACNTHHT